MTTEPLFSAKQAGGMYFLFLHFTLNIAEKCPIVLTPSFRNDMTNDPCVKRLSEQLYHIKGIKESVLWRRQLSISKQPLYDWEEVIPKVTEVIEIAYSHRTPG